MRSKMKRLADWLVYFAVRVLICVVQTMPIDTCHWWERLLSLIATYVIPIRRAVIDENLSHAYPDMPAAERRKLAQQTWEHLLLMLCEIAQVPRKFHPSNWRDYVRVDRIREMCQLLLAPRPTVVLSGH